MPLRDFSFLKYWFGSVPRHQSLNVEGRNRARFLVALVLSLLLHGAVLLASRSHAILISAGSYNSSQNETFSPVLFAELKSADIEHSLSVQNNPVGIESRLGAGEAEALLLSAREKWAAEKFRNSQVSADAAPFQAIAEEGNELSKPSLSNVPAKKTANGLAPAPGYVNSAQLDPPPLLLGEIVLNYPETAGDQEGRVVLRLLINESGSVDELDVVRAKPAGFFEGAAVAAFRGARFSAGRSLGVPVKSQVYVEVEFLPFNRGAAVSGKGY